MIEVERSADPVPFAQHVQVRVGRAHTAEAHELRRRVMALLAEQPRSLLCDLTTAGNLSADLLDVLTAVVQHQSDWPGTPVGVACSDPTVRERLDGGRHLGEHAGRLVVAGSVAAVQDMLAALPPARHATLTLEPGLTAPRSARAFVARTCLGWHARSVTGHACLVVSELVTNAVLHADTSVRLTVSHCPGRLRLAVQDADEASPVTSGTGAPGATLSSSGRGLLLVSSVCRAWGVLPTESGGKVVWAVLDDAASVSGPRPRSRSALP